MSSIKNINRVFIIYQRFWGIKFGQFYIDKLRIHYPDVEIGVLTVKKQADIFFREKNDLTTVKWYKYFDPIRDFSKEYLADDDYNITEICRDLKIKGIWEILYATRNHIKNYRKKYGYDFSPALNDNELITSFKAYYKLIKDIVENLSPDIIIMPNPVESFNILLESYAHAHDIKCIQLAPTYIKGFYQYVSNKNQGGGKIEKEFLITNTLYEENRIRALEYITEFRKNFIIPESAYHDSSKMLKYDVVSMAKTFVKNHTCNFLL